MVVSLIDIVKNECFIYSYLFGKNVKAGNPALAFLVSYYSKLHQKMHNTCLVGIQVLHPSMSLLILPKMSFGKTLTCLTDIYYSYIPL